MSKVFRFGRVFGEPHQRTVILPVDHGLSQIVKGLEDPYGMIERVVHEVPLDGVLMSLGMARQTEALFAHRNAPARIIPLDGHFSDDAGTVSAITVTLEQAARLGVDAVKVLMPWTAAARQRLEVSHVVATCVREAEMWDMPLIVEPVVWQPHLSEEATFRAQSDACRAAVELGADVLKIAHPGSPARLQDFVRLFKVPIVLLDSVLHGTAEELLDTIRQAFTVGAQGTVIGINIWQRGLEETVRIFQELVRLAQTVP